VRTLGGETVRARDVIVATNCPLLDRGLFFTRMEVARSYLVAARVRESTLDAMFITAGTPSRSLRCYHDGRDHWLLVGGEGHPTGSGEAQPERYEALESFAREHFDIIDIPYRWSTQDGMPDRQPSIHRLLHAGRSAPVRRRRISEMGHDERHNRRDHARRPDRRPREPLRGRL